MLQLFARRSLTPVLQRRCITTSLPLYAGHNKWSKIKDKKGANDAQKSILYSRATKDIGIAVRVGGSADPATNIQLANALRRAKEQGVPKDNIERALAKASGAKNEGGSIVTYEALVAGSVGVIIECVTDNVNRTLHSIREILNSYNARMAPVKFMFKRSGCITVEIDATSNNTDDLESEIMDLCMENDAEDILTEDSDTEGSRITRILCDSKNLASLEKVLIEKQGAWPIKVVSAEVAYIPVERSDADQTVEESVQELVERLEEYEGTYRVWTSFGL